MRYAEHAVPVGRRLELFVRTYEPIDATDRTVVLVHGASEHSGRHRHVAEQLCGNGWRVVAPDLRGHGRSGGRPMHIARFIDYVDDIARVYDRFALDWQATSQWGSSMGGLVTVRMAQRHPGRFAAFALASPLLGLAVRIPPLLRASGRVLSVTYPWKRFRTVVDPRDVTRNAESLARRKTDALHHKSVTAGWFFAVQAAIEDAWRLAATIETPVLVVQAGDDRVVDSAASRAWIDEVRSTTARYCELPGQFHELHFEDDWPRTVEFVNTWLAAQLNNVEHEVEPTDDLRSADVRPLVRAA